MSKTLWPVKYPVKDAAIWKFIFDPDITAWCDDDEVTYQTKADAMKVLFIDHAQFPTIGMRIMREYVDWVDNVEAKGGQYKHKYMIHPAHRVRKYLMYRIAKAKERWKTDIDDGKARTSLVEECAVNSFRVAVTYLNAVARWQGWYSGYNDSLLVTEDIKILQDTLLKEQATARAQVRDYAASSRFLTKRLTVTERDDIVTSWWSGEAARESMKTPRAREFAQVRGLLVCALQISLGRRGMDIRSIRLSMLFHHILPGVTPVSKCQVIGASLRHVKECHDNVEHLLGWARSKNRLECPLGAMALYLVYINDIAGCNIIEMLREAVRTKSKGWQRIMLIQCKDTPNTQPISYSTHNDMCKAGLTAAGVTHKTATTHLDRSTIGCDLIEKGVTVEDTGMYEGWYHNTAADCYLRGAFKTEPMLIAHGWDKGREGYTCWWETNTKIPVEILELVLPGLDLLVAEIEQCEYEEDKSLLQFTKCLLVLRSIYISDAVYKRPLYPAFPAYHKHPLFKSHSAKVQTSWITYALNEARAVENAPQDHKKNEERWIVDAVKGALSELGMTSGNQPHDVPIPVSVPVQTGALSAYLAPPQEDELIPHIKEPDNLYTFYADWAVRCRDYFSRVQRPPWDKQYGASARAMKVRYCHVKPYVAYLDAYSDDNNGNIRPVIDALDAIRKKYRVTASSFIKYCFYSLKHPVCASKPPAILPDVLTEAMIEYGLKLL